jgi:hypothetical protein
LIASGRVRIFLEFYSFDFYEKDAQIEEFLSSDFSFLTVCCGFGEVMMMMMQELCIVILQMPVIL